MADYPAPRLDRGTPVPSSTSITPTEPAVSLPRVRIWPFLSAAAAARYGQIVSPAFSGPAVITHLLLRITVASNVAIQELGLWASPDNGGEVENSVTAPVTTGRNLFDTGDINDAAIATDMPLGSLVFPSTVPADVQPMEVRLPIMDASFYLKWRFQAPATVAQGFSGWLRVVEGLLPGEVPNFL